MLRLLVPAGLLAAVLGSAGCQGGTGVEAPPAPPPPPVTGTGTPDPSVVYGGHTFTGDVRVHTGFHSQIMNNTRTYWVYLPPNYATETRYYPVLYLGDGDVLFDSTNVAGRTSEWQVDETAERLIRAGTIPPMIIVGIAVNANTRWDEYTPTYDPVVKRGGSAPLYARMLVEELKPEVDHNYRTLPDPANTGVGGSSLGGLLSLYLGLTRNNVFNRVMAMSPSVGWDSDNLSHQYQALTARFPVRYWLDHGSQENGDAVDRVKVVADLLVSKGWVLHQDVEFYIGPNQGHTDLAWRARIDPALRFLYGSH